MTVKEISENLGLPSSTHSRSIASRAVRRHCPGGVPLLDAKEWATGLVNFSADVARAEIAQMTLERLNAIQLDMLAGIEIQHRLPAGCLQKRLKAGSPE